MVTRGIDLKNLSLMDALDLAILIEEEARDRYEELADQMLVHHTPQAERFFRKMIGIEDMHREELATRREQLFGAQAALVSRSMIFDVEAPEYDEVRADMTPREALLVAMRAETKAHAFFAEALPHLQDKEVKALFAELRDEEVEHERWVQIELDRLPVIDEPEGDTGDEPVAH